MTTRHRTALLGLALAAAVLCTMAPPASAQSTTGTVRGRVTRADGSPLTGANLAARNLATGVRRSIASGTDGQYLLPGLVPGLYELTARYIGAAQQTRRVRVQVGVTHYADFALQEGAVAVTGIEVTAERPPIETRTSEVATNVTQEQLASLPSPERNFLDLATLAPGAVLQGDRINSTRRTVAFGAQAAEQINVFVDGATYKNDILLGGVVGQDASRGSPFPRNAIQEFRVITQNYKAEYQRASSGIITATTRSGTNEWRGSAFFGFIDRSLVALDSFQRNDQRTGFANFREPDYSRYQAGLSVGGPLIRDRFHVFLSYEGNYQDRTNRVNIDTVFTNSVPALDTIDWASRNGSFDSPFRQTSVFGKLSYALTSNSSLEFSVNVRHENDVRDFGGLTSFESATRFRNDVNTGVLKHSWFRGEWLNEATLSYQDYNYNPVPNSPGTVNRFYGFGCCAQLGSNISVQDFTQRRLSLRDDFTYSGFRGYGSHVVKAGLNVDFLDYDIIKRNSENLRFVYEPWFNNFEIPERVEFQFGDPNFGTSNTQIGAYLQDDWTPIPRLTINAGVRWDYETDMMNTDYVTPQAIRDSLTKYADSLYIPLDPNRYFTDGTQRSPFASAFQPRLGFSYQLDRRGRTTVFGGWGIFYDRSLFDAMIEESFALQHPSFRIRFRPQGDTDPNRVDWDPAYLAGGEAVRDQLRQLGQAATPEVKLLPNDLEPPMSRQVSLGVRHVIGTVGLSATYTRVRSDNTFTFYFANMNFLCPERSFGVAGCFDVNTVPGYSTILLADNSGKTWYDALQLQVDRPYRRTGRGGWGAGLAYTLAERETEGFNDLFSFPNPADYPRQRRNDERHRIVANWIMDWPWAWDVQFSGLLTLGTGTRSDVGDRFGGTTNPLRAGGFQPERFSFILSNAWAYRNVDVRFRKDFPAYRGMRTGVAVDVFNLFNHQNLGCYNTFNPSDANFGKAGCVISDPRRAQFTVTYEF